MLFVDFLLTSMAVAAGARLTGRFYLTLKTENMFHQVFKNIDDVLWKEAGCTTELDYTEQTSWMLFLKYLDDLEHEKAMAAELVRQALYVHHRQAASLVELGCAEEGRRLI
jgi:hypothetical protein